MADIFSTLSFCSQLLLGHHTFVGECAATIYKILRTAQPLLEEIDSSLPLDVVRIVEAFAEPRDSGVRGRRHTSRSCPRTVRTLTAIDSPA